jgi:hypothetical protein
MFRFLTQFVNYCTITLYPVYTPSAEEKADPALYASNVRAYMARVGGLKLSDSTLQALTIFFGGVFVCSLHVIQDKKDYLKALRGDDKLA